MREFNFSCLDMAEEIDKLGDAIIDRDNKLIDLQSELENTKGDLEELQKKVAHMEALIASCKK